MQKTLFFIIFVVIGFSFNGISQTKKIEISNEKVLVDGKVFYMHEVLKGQTTWSIAKAYNILLNELAEQNPSVFDSLRIGQELKIPIIRGRNFSANEISLADKFIYHYVEKSQTPYSVAHLYDSNTEILFKWNPNAITTFQPGQLVRLPQKGVTFEEIAILLEPKSNNEEQHVISIQDPGYFFYEVVKGNTLYSISKKYGVDLNLIISLNPGCDKGLSIGAMLKLPDLSPKMAEDIIIEDSQEEVELPIKIEIVKDTIKIDENIVLEEHRVKKGETLYSLSKKYDISKEDIINYNEGISKSISIGDVLLIPKKHVSTTNSKENESTEDEYKREDKKYYYHIVEKDEDISDIAKFYMIKSRKLKKANPKLKNSDVVVGQTLRIPKKDIRDIRLVSRRVKEKKSVKIEEEKEEVVVNIVDSLLNIPCGDYNYFATMDTIKIALMLPFYLYENDTIGMSDTIVVDILEKPEAAINIDNVVDAFSEPEIQIYNRSKVFLEFYEGFLIALDSLNKSGVNMKLYVYDTDRNKDSVIQILAGPELKNMNIIFGPVYEENLEIVNNFALNNGITVVSPVISGSNDSILNKSFFRAIPSTESQIERFSNYLSEYYHKNIILMHYGTPKELKNIEYYKKYLLPILYERTDSSEVMFSVVELDKQRAFDIIKPRKDDDEKDVFDHPIKNALIEDVPNFVIIPSKDRGLVSNTIRQLNTLYEEVVSDYEITVAGFSNARNFDNLDLAYLHNLEFHTFTTSYIDYSDLDVQDFVGKYRVKYKSEPSQFSFQGYDLLWQFVNMYKIFGPDFAHCTNQIASDTVIHCLQNDFEFIPVFTNGFYENKNIYVLKYDQNNNLVKMENKINSIEDPKVPVIFPIKKEIENPEDNLRLYRKPNKE